MPLEFKCDLCGEIFKTKVSLNKHITEKICSKKQEENVKLLLNNILSGQHQITNRLNSLENKTTSETLVIKNYPRKDNKEVKEVKEHKGGSSRKTIDNKKNKHNTYIQEVKRKMRDHLEIIAPEDTFDMKNYLPTIIELMKFVENFYISNSEKKMIVLDTIEEYVEKLNESESMHTLNFKYIDSNFIDIVIALDRNEMNIKENKKQCCVPM